MAISFPSASIGDALHSHGHASFKFHRTRSPTPPAPSITSETLRRSGVPSNDFRNQLHSSGEVVIPNRQTTSLYSVGPAKRWTIFPSPPSRYWTGVTRAVGALQ